MNIYIYTFSVKQGKYKTNNVQNNTRPTKIYLNLFTMELPLFKFFNRHNGSDNIHNAPVASFPIQHHVDGVLF